MLAIAAAAAAAFPSYYENEGGGGGERTVRSSFSYFCTFALFSVRPGAGKTKAEVHTQYSTTSLPPPLVRYLRPRRVHDK